MTLDMSRRSFLKFSGAVTATAATGGLAITAKEAKQWPAKRIAMLISGDMEKHIDGANGYAIRFDIDFAGTREKAVEVGKEIKAMRDDVRGTHVTPLPDGDGCNIAVHTENHSWT